MPETNDFTDNDDCNSKIDKAILDLKENEVIAFVDGSYDKEQEKSAFGAIILVKTMVVMYCIKFLQRIYLRSL